MTFITSKTKAFKFQFGEAESREPGAEKIQEPGDYEKLFSSIIVEDVNNHKLFLKW